MLLEKCCGEGFVRGLVGDRGRDLLEDLEKDLVVDLTQDLVEDYFSDSYLQRLYLSGLQVMVMHVDMRSPADGPEAQVVEQSLLKGRNSADDLAVQGLSLAHTTSHHAYCS